MFIIHVVIFLDDIFEIRAEDPDGSDTDPEPRMKFYDYAFTMRTIFLRVNVNPGDS